MKTKTKFEGIFQLGQVFSHLRKKYQKYHNWQACKITNNNITDQRWPPKDPSNLHHVMEKIPKIFGQNPALNQ